MTYRLAMFDWNGTLLNDVEIAHQAASSIFRQFSLKPPTLDEYRNGMTSDIVSFYHKRGVPPTVTLAEMNQTFRKTVFEQWDKPRFQPYALKLIKECRRRKMRLAIVSADVPLVLLGRITQFRLMKKFDEVHGGILNKGEQFRKTLTRFGIAPDESFYIDDSPGGLRAAKALGVKAVGFTGGYNSEANIRAADPDFVVSSLKQVITIVEQGNRMKEGGR